DPGDRRRRGVTAGPRPAFGAPHVPSRSAGCGSSMSRRRAPRPASEAIRAARARAAPQTGLGSIQAQWRDLVGPRLAAVAAPVAERAGTLTIECEDAVWAEELNLMQELLLERLRGALGERSPQALRFRVRSD